MGHITRSPVDREAAHGTMDSPQTPGLLIVAAAALAFVVCVVNFALGDAGAGVTAGIVALLGFGAGLAWLSMDRRRIRQAERDWVVSRPAR
ncbi:hypothetical protein MSAS_06510 [Mycobacterium saskatchewanense]|uniref:UsfY protein n=1 Tax=Mycobacterium saskatchewanense TaxID=220927 RepID=A0AAJ3NMV3_9MYCO|nr:hypothetical protein AWC23_17900 [Mycobacterium saskatchewanense]BBX61477.1 hypothetical protein MSAS_06510 [Mycobacterium saskatchewanense]